MHSGRERGESGGNCNQVSDAAQVRYWSVPAAACFLISLPPCFLSLLESLRKETTDTAKVKQLMALTDEGAPTRRKIGKAVAERIVEILCGSVYKQRVVSAGGDDDD